MPGFLALALGVGVPGPAFADAARPRAVVAEAAHDLGVVAVGAGAAHEFTIRNEGDAPLTLGDPRPSRGARVTAHDPAVPPGEVGRVRVAVDTWAVRGPTRLAVTLATSDPDRARVELRLAVDVRAFLLARPGFARYVFVQGADEGTIAQTVWSVDGADFRVLEARSPEPHLGVAFREARPAEAEPGAAGRQWRIELTLASTSPVGPLHGVVVVRTDHPRQPELRIPVSGFVRPMFAVTPPAARLGDVDPARPPRLSLHVKNFAEELVALTGVSSDVPGVGAELVTVEAGRVYRVRVSVRPDIPAGAFSGTLRIRTASPRQPTVEVPLTGRIVPAALAPGARIDE